MIFIRNYLIDIKLGMFRKRKSVWNRWIEFRFRGTFWKFARIGQRKSQYVALFCLGMAFSVLFWQ